MSNPLFEKAIRELESREEDVRPSDVVLFPEPLRSAVNFVIRLGRFSLTEFAEKLPDFTKQEVKQIADLLIQRHLFDLSRFATEAEPYYEARLSAMTRPLSRPPSDIWKKID
ncbi:MAG: hypothetical protein H6635_04755 [Anaerolineales bacterium]|nr:hypothetical protein [Anaerolineales bacterium]MCB9144660.1 hypothetical protein [Anaerolineales bacterium]